MNETIPSQDAYNLEVFLEALPGKRQTLCWLSPGSWQKSDPPPRITCSQVGRVRCHHTPDSHCSQLGFIIDIRIRYSYLISILTNNSAKTITTSILSNNRASPSWTSQRIHPTSAPKHPCDYLEIPVRYEIHLTHYWACGYLSTLGLKLIMLVKGAEVAKIYNCYVIITQGWQIADWTFMEQNLVQIQSKDQNFHHKNAF